MGRKKRRRYENFEDAHTAAKSWLDGVSVYVDAPYWVKLPKQQKDAIIECRRILERVEHIHAFRLEQWGHAWLDEGERGALKALADGGAPADALRRAQEAGQGSPTLFPNTTTPADVVQVYLVALDYFRSVLDGPHTLGEKDGQATSALRVRIRTNKQAFITWFSRWRTDKAAMGLAYSLRRFDFAELRRALKLPTLRMPQAATRSAPLTDTDMDYLRAHTEALASHIAEQVVASVKRSKRWPMSAHVLAFSVVATSEMDESTFTKARNKKGA